MIMSTSELAVCDGVQVLTKIYHNCEPQKLRNHVFKYCLMFPKLGEIFCNRTVQGLTPSNLFNSILKCRARKMIAQTVRRIWYVTLRGRGRPMSSQTAAPALPRLGCHLPNPDIPARYLTRLPKGHLGTGQTFGKTRSCWTEVRRSRARTPLPRL